jgi:hypothetical protein
MCIFERRKTAAELEHEARVALYLNPDKFARLAVAWFLRARAEREARAVARSAYER